MIAEAEQWAKCKHWSDEFIPEIKRILGEVLIGEAPVEEDRERNTDLIVLRMDPVRIACRVRRPGYFERYHDKARFFRRHLHGVNSREGMGDGQERLRACS